MHPVYQKPYDILRQRDHIYTQYFIKQTFKRK